VTVSAASDVYFDPYDVELNADPYPMFRRLREEVPLYYNEQHDFYALSRFADVDDALIDFGTFSSAKGAILELIKANIDIPSGVLLFEDPPIHDIHRKLLSRMFTPRKINELESKIREFCAHSLDPLVGTGRFDFVADLGAQMPMRVIGMLLGVPEEFQEAARDRANANLRTEAGKPMDATGENMMNGEFFGQFIDWRAEHPSDDIMTELLHVEFEDGTGTVRRLRPTNCSPISAWCPAPATKPPPGSSDGPERCWPNTPTSGVLWPRTGRSFPRPSRSCCATNHRRHTWPGT
jgi:cytochrome P450